MHSSFYRRCFLIVTAAVLGYAAYRIVAPLLGILGWGIVLAFSLYPLHEWLTRVFKGRNSLSAGIIAGVTPFVVFVPLSVLGAVFAGQVARIIAYLSGPTRTSPIPSSCTGSPVTPSSGAPWRGCRRTPP